MRTELRTKAEIKFRKDRHCIHVEGGLDTCGISAGITIPWFDIFLGVEWRPYLCGDGVRRWSWD